MLCLTLTEQRVPGGHVRNLGVIEIHQERSDPTTDVASYSLESAGHRVGTIWGWRRWHGPWRLVQAALNTIYGGVLAASETVCRDDGRCNAKTKRGRRCRMPARDGGFYCQGHDPMRRP